MARAPALAGCCCRWAPCLALPAAASAPSPAGAAWQGCDKVCWARWLQWHAWLLGVLGGSCAALGPGGGTRSQVPPHLSTQAPNPLLLLLHQRLHLLQLQLQGRGAIAAAAAVIGASCREEGPSGPAGGATQSAARSASDPMQRQPYPPAPRPRCARSRTGRSLARRQQHPYVQGTPQRLKGCLPEGCVKQPRPN